MTRFQCIVDAHAKTIEVKATGSLGSGNAGAFHTSLMALARGCEEHLVVNVTGLRFVSSTGLRAILMAAQHLRSEKRKFLLCGLQPKIEHVLKTTGFDRRIEIRPTREDALRELAESSDPVQPA